MSSISIDSTELIELRMRARRLNLTLSKRTLARQVGEQRSDIRGRGLDFLEFRTYQPGDDVRSIDWRASVRQPDVQVRVYSEERRRPVIFVVDLRPDMWFGTRSCFKNVLAARAAALCGWSAADAGQFVGGTCFDGTKHAEVRPRGGSDGVLKLINTLSDWTPPDRQPGSNELAGVIQRIRRIASPSSLVVFLSDFRDFDQAASGHMRALGKHSELVLGFVFDPIEAELPSPKVYSLAMPGMSGSYEVDTSDPRVRTRWSDAFETRRARARDLAKGCRGHWIELQTGAPLEPALLPVLQRRSRVA